MKRLLVSLFSLIFILFVFKVWIAHLPTTEQWLSIAAPSRFPGILLILLCACGATALRGMRWAILLEQFPQGTFRAILVQGWSTLLANYSPFRIGEGIKALMSKGADCSAAYACGLVVLERFYDVSALCLLFFLIFWDNTALPLPSQIGNVLQFLAPAAILFFFFSPLLLFWLDKRFSLLQRPAICRLHKIPMLADLFRGMTAIRSVPRHGTLLLASSGAFLLMAFGYAVYLQTYAPEITWVSGLSIVVLVNLVGALGLTPANIGPYELVAVTGLSLYNIGRDDALVYAVGLHVWVLIAFTSVGILCRILLFLWPRRPHAPEQALSSSPGSVTSSEGK